jgi:hypothetical protein
MVPLRTCARRSGPNQYAMGPSFSCATAPSFHVRRAPGLSQYATAPPSRSDQAFTQCAIAPPPSCGISFPCATASNGAALVSDGAFTHCTSFLVWNMILPMCDSTLLFTRDGAAFSLPMGPSLSVPSRLFAHARQRSPLSSAMVASFRP